MTERIFICGGGSGHRITGNVPKMLFKLPSGEIVLDRHFRLLAGYDIPVTLCIGYRKELVRIMYPDYETVVTYDPDNPTGILCCMKEILDTYKLRSYVFLLGDTIWSRRALAQALDSRYEKQIVFFGNHTSAPCETYMATFHDEGIELIKGVLERKEFPRVISQDTSPIISLRGCKIFHMDHWMDHTKHPWVWNKKRIKSEFPATDFDIDSEKEAVWKQYEEGYFD